MSCCDKPKTDDKPEVQAAASCCGADKAPHTSNSSNTNCESDGSAVVSSCCDTADNSIDWMLWGCFLAVAFLYSLNIPNWLDEWLMEDFFSWRLSPGLNVISATVYELVNTMWFSVILAAAFVGLLAKIPQAFVTSILGKGGTVSGLWRATMAGVLMDLCSHGILMVGMQLYRKGASLGQVMAFLIASPWNSLSLTIILFTLIGWQWTLSFIALSMVLALTTGYLFDCLVANGTLPPNSNDASLAAPDGASGQLEDFEFWPAAKKSWAGTKLNAQWWSEVWQEALSGSKMVVRWLLFGILLAAFIRGFVALEDFQTYFGPSVLGLAATLLAATIIEVCSEGSTPIAADLMTRAQAPGNSFAFLMAGVATDYTEVMVIKDTMKSWKIALFLPLLTLPQVVVIALVLNQF